MTALGTIVSPGPLLAMLTQILAGRGPAIDCFESEHGIHGQAWVEGTRLHILSVIATNPGTGQLRRFIKACKTEYSHVYVWEIMNPELGRILRRYGFTKARRVEPDGEVLTGYKWRVVGKGESRE